MSEKETEGMEYEVIDRLSFMLMHGERLNEEKDGCRFCGGKMRS